MEFFPNFDRSAQQETSGKSLGTSICQNVTLLKGLSVNSLNYYRIRVSRHFNRNPIVSVSSIFITKPIVKWIHPMTSEEMERTLNTDNGPSKGQLISKCLFGVFTFFQKTNENKSTRSKVKFVHSFFGRNVGLKKSFRICLTFSTNPISNAVGW